MVMTLFGKALWIYTRSALYSFILPSGCPGRSRVCLPRISMHPKSL